MSRYYYAKTADGRLTWGIGTDWAEVAAAALGVAMAAYSVGTALRRLKYSLSGV